MKKCFIFGGGIFDGLFDEIKDDDLIIAADKGYTYLNKLNLKADYIIGDFDSSDEPNFDKKIKLCPEKDVTDLYAAVEIAVDKGYKDIVVYGGLGGRVSHTIGNIKILEEFKNKNINIVLKNKNQKLFVINENFKEEIYIDDIYVSIFALSDEVLNLDLINLKYELKNHKLKGSDHMGISNEAKNIPFEINFKKGTLLIIYEKKSEYFGK